MSYHSLHEDLAAVIMACEVHGLTQQRTIINALQLYRTNTFNYIHRDKYSEDTAEGLAFQDVNNYLTSLKEFSQRRGITA